MEFINIHFIVKNENYTAAVFKFMLLLCDFHYFLSTELSPNFGNLYFNLSRKSFKIKTLEIIIQYFEKNKNVYTHIQIFL